MWPSSVFFARVIWEIKGVVIPKRSKKYHLLWRNSCQRHAFVKHVQRELPLSSFFAGADGCAETENIGLH